LIIFSLSLIRFYTIASDIIIQAIVSNVAELDPAAALDIAWNRAESGNG